MRDGSSRETVCRVKVSGGGSLASPGLSSSALDSPGS